MYPKLNFWFLKCTIWQPWAAQWKKKIEALLFKLFSVMLRTLELE
jgi:hypothetical protein